MDTCFLFTDYLDDSGCLSLKLSHTGEVITAPTQLGFKEIKELQQASTTILVESCAYVTLISLELPWLTERKARLAIPYALEDKLTQPVHELHFAFDKQYYQNNQYLIAVIAKERMRYIVQQMNEHHIEFERITIDWCALDKTQVCVSGANLLINADDFKGALSGSLAYTYLQQHPEAQSLLFKDSELKITNNVEHSNNYSYIWIAQKLLHLIPLNLSQGELQHNTGIDWVKRGYKLVLTTCAIWLISMLLVNAWQVHSLNKKTEAIDNQIALIYHQFFPDAKQVISPRFRISHLLKSKQEEHQNRFWFLLNEFAKTIKNSSITIEQMRYQNKILAVTVVSPDFAALQKLETNLKQAQLHVNQTQASTHDQQVIATLELT